MKLAIASLAALAIAAPAMAEPQFYINGGYTALDGDDATLSALTARGGAFFNEYFGVEGEFSIGLGEEDIGGGASIELDNQYAAYVIGKAPLSPQFDVFARLGYGQATFSASAGTVSGDVDVDGFSAGFGGQYFFTDQVGVRGEYTRFEADDDQLDGGADVFSISAVIRF